MHLLYMYKACHAPMPVTVPCRQLRQPAGRVNDCSLHKLLMPMVIIGFSINCYVKVALDTTPCSQY